MLFGVTYPQCFPPPALAVRARTWQDVWGSVRNLRISIPRTAWFQLKLSEMILLIENGEYSHNDPAGGDPVSGVMFVRNINARKTFLPITLLMFGTFYLQQSFLVIMCILVNAV